VGESASDDNLGIYLWACGDADEAEKTFARVTKRMATGLGDEHPHTLFARANHANVLAEQGRPEEAWALEEPARNVLKEILGPQHPETLAVISNSALTLRSLGREEEAQRLREATLADLRRLGRQLGEGNGITRLVGQRRRAPR
jgi:tetratricopeptide (TPR) repeat protein